MTNSGKKKKKRWAK